MRAENVTRTVEEALRGSLAPHVNPALVPQAVELLKQNVHLVNDGTGKLVPCGPELQPLGSFVQAQLEGSLAHFKRTGPGPTPGPGSVPAPAATGISPDTLAMARRGQGVGDFILEKMKNRAAVAPNAGQLDMTKPFGIGRVRGA